MKCAPLSASFGIKELRWSGRLSVLLRPLIKTIPLVGAVHGAMIDHPIIEMDFTGIANITEFGPLEKVVNKVMKNVTASMVVLPNRIMYKLSDAVDFFDTSFPPLGVMLVTIKRGRGFASKKRIGLMKSIPDIFCRATFGLEEMATEVKWNTVNPEWNAGKAFIISAMSQPFRLKCWDRDVVSTDDLLGQTTIAAKELLQLESKWIRLRENVKMNVAGNAEILLLSNFYSFSRHEGPVTGRCVVTVLVDRASSLPSNSKAVSCCVYMGSFKKETNPIRRPQVPIPGFDPINPVWNFSCDALCENISKALVKLVVLDCGKEIGSIDINVAEIARSTSKSKQGYFKLNTTATVRAKVIVRGLVLDALPEIDRN
ncbi:Synaptotagmin [Gracilaria domingensis]|nr:Synaptotagmin [Gracilaria domingensis]